MTAEADNSPHNVAQASSPESSGTVSVPIPIGTRLQASDSGGQTPPELAGGTPAIQEAALHDATNPLVDGFHFRGVLPHLKREGGTYFVTFRQAGTLPKEVVTRLKHERNAIIQHALVAKRPLTWHEQEELFRWYAHRVDKYLDAGHGTCHFRDSVIADLVAAAIQFFQGQRYELHAWMVMPNHVHVVVWPMPGHSLSDILHSWKSFTAHEINKLLPNKIVPFWQSESYEHLIRDDEDLHRCCHYVLMNPVNAKICARPENWKWSSVYAKVTH